MAKDLVVEELRIIYQEVIDGCSPSAKEDIFVKHLTELENIEVLRYKLKSFNKHIRAGIPSEDDRMAVLRKNEQWSQDEDDRITSLRLTISDNEKNLSKYVIVQQQAGVRKAIEKDKQELVELLTRKHDLLGATADELSFRDANVFSLFLSLYKDRTCQTKMFSEPDALDNLDNEEYDDLSDLLQASLEKITEPKLRQISVLPFFLNAFSYSKEDITTFISKPVSQMTNYQTLLFSLGQRNLSVLGQSEGHPPDLFGDTTPNDILTWYDRQYSVILGKRNADK